MKVMSFRRLHLAMRLPDMGTRRGFGDAKDRPDYWTVTETGMVTLALPAWATTLTV
jgi:hypothetical protein